MSRVYVLALAVVLVAGLLVSVITALIDPGDTSVYQLGAGDRVPSYPPGLEPFDHVARVDPADQTTTTARPKQGSAASYRAATISAAGTVNGYPCGGDLPPCTVLACESGGNPSADNPTSTASGLWQILDGTWSGYGGYARALHAPADVQNAKARILWAGGAGSFHWQSCL